MIDTSDPNKEWRFWLIVGVILVALIWVLGEVITPFLLAMLIAYLLDPLAERLNRLGVPRGLSAAAALLMFITLIALLAAVIGPIVRTQINDLIRAMPGYIEVLQNDIWPRFSALIKQVPALSNVKLQIANLTQYTGDAMNLMGILVGRVVTGGWALLHLLMFFILTPVIAFYLLRDWPRIVQQVESLFPAHRAAIIKQELRAIDDMIAGFVRGQATVSLCLAALYSAGLFLTGLKYGMTIGLVTGLLSFIPVVGTMIGAVTSITLAFIQFDDPMRIAMVAGVFLVAQALDGYFLTPYLVGTKVGLHPVWIIFAVIAGGALFGFFGVVFAVPVAGIIAILLRVALRQYRSSSYYLPPST